MLLGSSMDATEGIESTCVRDAHMVSGRMSRMFFSFKNKLSRKSVCNYHVLSLVCQQVAVLYRFTTQEGVIKGI